MYIIMNHPKMHCFNINSFQNELFHREPHVLTYIHTFPLCTNMHQKLVYYKFWASCRAVPWGFWCLADTYSTQPHQQLNWIENWLLLWALRAFSTMHYRSREWPFRLLYAHKWNMNCTSAENPSFSIMQKKSSLLWEVNHLSLYMSIYPLLRESPKTINYISSM